MGYSTFYNLYITENTSKKTNEEIIKEFRDSCEGAKDSFDADGGCQYEAKWYSHEKDMAAFSKKHPDVVFELYGEGEGKDDTWYKYFKNGKMQFCPAIINYDKYDESKLTKIRRRNG